MSEVTKEVKLTPAEQDAEIKRLEIEAKQLEIQERKFHIADLRTRIQDREIREMQLAEDRASQGRTIAQQDAADRYRFSVCTHRKGGTVSNRDARALSVGGNSNQYAVIKHQMINGDIWVRCLRCGKTWAPPVERNFIFNSAGQSVSPKNGVFDAAKFNEAVADYKKATMFETNNSMSASVQCRFETRDEETGRKVDGSDVYRDNIASTTLR